MRWRWRCDEKRCVAREKEGADETVAATREAEAKVHTANSGSEARLRTFV